MNKFTILLAFLITLTAGFVSFLPEKSFAAFPISNEHRVQVEKQDMKTRLQQKQYKAILQKEQVGNRTSAGDDGIYGILALCMGVAGWATVGFGIGFLLLLGAFITGIIGLNEKRKYKGMALAGLILGAAGILVFIFAVLIFAAWLL